MKDGRANGDSGKGKISKEKIIMTYINTKIGFHKYYGVFYNTLT